MGVTFLAICVYLDANFSFIGGPACSSLHKEMLSSTHRSSLKRRASENVKPSPCTSPEKVTRVGSISPHQHVSLISGRSRTNINPQRMHEGYCSNSMCLLPSPKCCFVWFLPAFQTHVLCGFR